MLIRSMHSRPSLASSALNSLSGTFRSASNEPRAARVVSDLDGRWVNDRQKIGELPSKSQPLPAKQFSNPKPTIRRLHRPNAALGLHVAFEIISLIRREDG